MKAETHLLAPALMAKRGLVTLFAALLALAWQSDVANAVSWLPAAGCTTNCRDDHTCLKTDTGCSDAWSVCPEGFEAVGDGPSLLDEIILTMLVFDENSGQGRVSEG